VSFDNSQLKPRKFGDILTETFNVYGGNFIKIVAIVTFVMVPLGLLNLVLELNGFPSDNDDGITIMLVIGWITFGVLCLILYPLMGGSLIHSISKQSLSLPISIGESYSFAWKKIGTLVGATIIAAILLSAMSITIILIPLAIYFAIRWVFIEQIIVMEDCAVGDAFSRSSTLVKKNWWRIFAVLIVIFIIVIAINLTMGMIPIIGPIISLILATPVMIIATTLLYYDIRLKKEDYNLETMAKELEISYGVSLTEIDY